MACIATSSCARVAGQHGGRHGAGVGRNYSMSNQDLPVGRRRDDQTDLVQPASISSAPPWDSVLDRLTNLERSHADLARLVTSIHEALPPEIAAAAPRTYRAARIAKHRSVRADLRSPRPLGSAGSRRRGVLPTARVARDGTRPSAEPSEAADAPGSPSRQGSPSRHAAPAGN